MSLNKETKPEQRRGKRNVGATFCEQYPNIENWIKIFFFHVQIFRAFW